MFVALKKSRTWTFKNELLVNHEVLFRLGDLTILSQISWFKLIWDRPEQNQKVDWQYSHLVRHFKRHIKRVPDEDKYNELVFKKGIEQRKMTQDKWKVNLSV